MDVFEKKEIQVARGYTYTYYVSPAIDGHDSTSPALLFLHGFPDSAELWQFVAPQLLPLATKHRIVIPDLLGAGDTSKPTHSPAYTFSYMTQDLVNILDAEGIKSAIPIGHDWGSVVAQRFCLYAPERTAGLMTLNVAYRAPDAENLPTVDAMNRATMNAFGYNCFEYMKFFISADAGAIMGANPEKCWELCHGDEENWLKRLWCADGAVRRYLTDDSWKVKQLRPYAQNSKLRNAFVERITRNGIQGGLMYYRANFDGCQFEAEKSIPKERAKLNFPVLFIGCDQDIVCRKEVVGISEKMGLLPDLRVVEIDCGHWCPLEQPDQVAAAIIDFLKQKF